MLSEDVTGVASSHSKGGHSRQLLSLLPSYSSPRSLSWHVWCLNVLLTAPGQLFLWALLRRRPGLDSSHGYPLSWPLNTGSALQAWVVSIPRPLALPSTSGVCHVLQRRREILQGLEELAQGVGWPKRGQKSSPVTCKYGPHESIRELVALSPVLTGSPWAMASGADGGRARPRPLPHAGKLRGTLHKFNSPVFRPQPWALEAL